jgi:hypothetical protein
MRKRVVRLLILAMYSGGLLLLILAVLSVSVRIQDWVFRHRAERLFDDIQSIDITHSTFQDVSSIFVRLDRSGGFVGLCSEQHCDFGIAISEPTIWRDNSKPIPILLRFYRLLGGHPAIARASINVRNGFVQAKHYSLAIEAPPVLGADGRSLTYYVEGNISTEPQANANDPVRLPMTSHPEYQIGSDACLGCVEIHVKFTSSADPADVRRLSHINFSCLTRQHSCRTKEDIMPIAASERSQELRPSNAPS